MDHQKLLWIIKNYYGSSKIIMDPQKLLRIIKNYYGSLKIIMVHRKSAVGPPNLGRAQAPYSSLSFCLLGKK